MAGSRCAKCTTYLENWMARRPRRKGRETNADDGRCCGREGAAPMSDRDRIEFHLFAIAVLINLAVAVYFLGEIARAVG